MLETILTLVRLLIFNQCIHFNILEDENYAGHS